MPNSIPPPPFYRFRPHPWHGLDAGEQAPKIVNAYIEITPFDTMKYEIDKSTGYLKVDRPQRGSAQPPTLYGFIPRTYCAQRVAALSSSGVDKADGDPLDICVVSERPITRSEILLDARVVGGIRMIDRGEADDKIIAVLDNDPYYKTTNDIARELTRSEHTVKIHRSRVLRKMQARTAAELTRMVMDARNAAGSGNGGLAAARVASP